MNKDDFYLQDIVLLKLLQPILAKKGISEDAYIPYFIASTDIETGKETLISDKILDLDGSYYRRDFHAKAKIELYEPSISEQAYYALKKLNDETGKPFDLLLPTWRKDSLEAALSDTVYNLVSLWIEKFKLDLLEPRIKLLRTILQKTGQESIKALGELIVLLEKEGWNE